MPRQSRAINLSEWVQKAKIDPVKYRQRQVTEILLVAISIVPSLRESLYLKGGLLLNLVYDSPRATGDVDFSTTANPIDYVPHLCAELDKGMQRAAATLGYTDLICRVQTVKEKPHKLFSEARFPALNMTIGSALRGTGEEQRLHDGQAPQTLPIDISFNEPVELIEPIAIDTTGKLDGYSLVEVIAEKLRALLQQKKRNRTRRQDVYDIAYLLEHFPLDDEEQGEVLRMLRLKAEARDITPDIDSLSDPEIAERAGQAWETMQQELEEPLPNFQERFALVEAFYRSLPWDDVQQ